MTNIVKDLRGASYAMPSENGEWVERGGGTVPMNVCIRAADEIERLRALLSEAVYYIPLGDERGNPFDTEYDFVKRVNAALAGNEQAPNEKGPPARS